MHADIDTCTYTYRHIYKLGCGIVLPECRRTISWQCPATKSMKNRRKCTNICTYLYVHTYICTFEFKFFVESAHTFVCMTCGWQNIMERRELFQSHFDTYVKINNNNRNNRIIKQRTSEYITCKNICFFFFVFTFFLLLVCLFL